MEEITLTQDPYYISKAESEAAASALGRVLDGRAPSPGVSGDGELDLDLHDQWWSRLVAQGKIVFKIKEGYGTTAHRLSLYAVKHPDLPEDQVYALVQTLMTPVRVYKCTASDARICLSAMYSYNL